MKRDIYLYVMPWMSAFGHAGRRQRLGAAKSLKADEAQSKKAAAMEKQLSMTEMAPEQAGVLQCCRAAEPGGV